MPSGEPSREGFDKDKVIQEDNAGALRELMASALPSDE
jgi:hypothetical protein